MHLLIQGQIRCSHIFFYCTANLACLCPKENANLGHKLTFHLDSWTLFISIGCKPDTLWVLDRILLCRLWLFWSLLLCIFLFLYRFVRFFISWSLKPYIQLQQWRLCSFCLMTNIIRILEPMITWDTMVWCNVLAHCHILDFVPF
jgi:hypothetical protein